MTQEASGPEPRKVLPGTSIELLRDIERGGISHVLMDFDGTISFIRDGWQNVMVPLMVEVLMETPNHESEDEITKTVIGYVDRLTGKQTIYQMMQLKEEVEKRGGTPKDPREYKQMYNDRLLPIVDDRISTLDSGEIAKEELMTKGSEEFLRTVSSKGIPIYLASGTDIEFVKNEARVLGVDDYFTGGIFGALKDYKLFSKEMVIQDIIKRFELSGSSLLVVGDGYVEILNARQHGATALGVYSPENNVYEMNTNKRRKLIEAGADILMPDFSESADLIDYLFPA